MRRIEREIKKFKIPIKVIAYGGPGNPPREVNITGVELNLGKDGTVRNAYLVDDQGEIYIEDMRKWDERMFKYLVTLSETIQSLNQLWEMIWDSLDEPCFPELPNDLGFVPGIGLGRR